jgi:hypothetical protein
MAQICYFFWLGSQAIEVALFFYPEFAFIAACGLIASIVAGIRNPEPLRRRWVLLVVPALIPVAILGYGVAFNYAGAMGTAPQWRSQVVDALFWSHIPVAIPIMVMLRRNPLVPLGVSGFLMWYSRGAAVMSSMSVTNEWL